MIKNRNIIIFTIILSMTCLISAAAIGLILANTYASSQYGILSKLTEHILLRYPDSEQDLLKLIKENTLLQEENILSNEGALSAYGYTPKIFAAKYREKAVLFVIIFIPLFLFLLFLLFLTIKNIYRMRIANLTGYLWQVNQDKDAALISSKEDDFSQLEDEIYKTVTKLRLTKETAVEERRNLADNLADIAHQVKTPLASISLMTQLLDSDQNHTYIERIKKQTTHLEQLIEALLTLSRIDAGALKLEKNPVDIYTMLQLSLDSLEEIIRRKRIEVSLPNHPSIFFQGDMEWSIEAFINLIKNSVEHTPEEGFIKIDYHQNPLYVEIKLEDNGLGFNERDIPHVFERFYRGENASEGGIGIGLSLAKAIIEQQNGIISAKNLYEGGACFIIRFYSH